MEKIKELILASGSSIRRTILETLEIPFRVCPAGIDEKEITDSSTKILAQKRALGKAKDVADKSPESLVIGCDQVLSFQNRAFSKPKTTAEAKDQLLELQGQEHWLYSATSVFYGSKELGFSRELFSWVSPVRMKMRNLSEEEIKSYISTGEWQGSVGGYKIEGQGHSLFKSYEPSHDQTIIMGLPLKELLEKLQELKLYNPKKGLAHFIN